MYEEVENMIEEHKLDDEASNALRDLDEDFLRELMERGPLTDARNPSAVLLSRIRSIRAAQNNPNVNNRSAYMQHEISKFVSENDLDSRAEAALKEHEDNVLKELFNNRGKLTDARNPSAVVLSRLKEIKRDLEREETYAPARRGGGGGKGGGNSRSAGTMATQIQNFVEDNNLDERAESCLRESDTAVLKELFSRGPLTDAKNPSAVTLARLREIKKDIGTDSRRQNDEPPRRGGRGGRDDSRDERGGKGGGGKGEFMDFMNNMWEMWNSMGSKSTESKSTGSKSKGSGGKSSGGKGSGGRRRNPY